MVAQKRFSALKLWLKLSEKRECFFNCSRFLHPGLERELPSSSQRSGLFKAQPRFFFGNSLGASMWSQSFTLFLYSMVMSMMVFSSVLSML